MRWKTGLMAVAAAVTLSAATMTTGAVAHGGGGGGHSGFGGHGFGGSGFGGHSFGGHAFVGGRFAHFDGRFGRFGSRRHFFFAGVGPGFYDWPYYDYDYSDCRVLTRHGWVWACQ
jgi:hypothetical protein